MLALARGLTFTEVSRGESIWRSVGDLPSPGGCLRQLYEDSESREMAELSMDLEEDRPVKADVMEALNESLEE
jgi:hypothetical protein